MASSWLWVAAPLCGAAGVTFLACNSSGTALPPQDAGAAQDVVHFEGATPYDAGNVADSPGPADGGAEAEGGPPPRRLLLTYNGSSESEIVAFGLKSKAVDGRLTFGDSLGSAYAGTTAPWLLEQFDDVVGRLDAQQPWVLDATWSVAMNDLSDAGYAQGYSDPQAVLVGAGAKAYVLRYNRNLVAVLDTSLSPDGGAPAGSIDLTGEVQAGGDGYVQPVGGVYVAAQNRVYAVLGNIDRFDVVNQGYNLLCANTTPTVIAIDTTSDTLVDLNGAAPGDGWPLVGYNPAQGPTGFAYDPATGPAGRLLVLEAGCNEVDADGGVGALVKREVESIDLATGQATRLLDLTGGGFPYNLTYVDAHHAVVAADQVYAWDPTTTSLGAPIANAPESFVYDGAGNLVGMNTDYDADGGVTGYEVVSTALADGTATTLGTFEFTPTNGFPGGVALWPAP
ncbi:MAG: hypothetical protein ACRELB_14695 [Polyangiaceae bacterium]